MKSSNENFIFLCNDIQTFEVIIETIIKEK